MTRAIDPEQSLGLLAAERPGLTEALEQLRFDYCCGGDQTLAEACRRRGLDPETVAVLLDEVIDNEARRRVVPHDLRGATLVGLCDHVLSAHHDWLRHELPRISELLATVVRVHASEHPQLHDLERLFSALAHDLLEHLEREERQLFSAARALAEGGRVAAALTRAIDEHASEHAQTGDALAALRELAGGYRVDRAYCGTHRSLLEALDRLEFDLHQHIHEENNLLFPQLRAVLGQ